MVLWMVGCYLYQSRFNTWKCSVKLSCVKWKISNITRIHTFPRFAFEFHYGKHSFIFYCIKQQQSIDLKNNIMLLLLLLLFFFCWMEVLMGNKCYDRSLEWANFLHFYEIIWQTNQQTSSQTTNRETNGRTWGVIG